MGELVSIDFKTENLSETKQQGHFLKDLLPPEEFENFDTGTDYNPKVKKRKNADTDYDPKVKKKKKSSKKNTGSKISTNSDGEIKPKYPEKRKPAKRNPDDIFLYPYVKYISINSSKETMVQCLCCNSAGNSYIQRKGLVFRHLRTVHKDEINWEKAPEKLYDCETRVCLPLYGSWFKQLWCTQCPVILKMKAKEREKKRREKEMRTGPNRIKVYKLCPDCGKNVENLSQHTQAMHSNEEHKCPRCDMVFNSKRYVETHIKAVHEKTPCVECGILVSNMKRHISRQHTSNDDKKDKCDVCGKGFARKEHLPDHKNIHTGEKPYKCKFCSACFASRGNHNIHERSHLGYKRKSSK